MPLKRIEWVNTFNQARFLSVDVYLLNMHNINAIRMMATMDLVHVLKIPFTLSNGLVLTFIFSLWEKYYQ